MVSIITSQVHLASKYISRELVRLKDSRSDPRQLAQFSESIREVGVGVAIAVLLMILFEQDVSINKAFSGIFVTILLWYIANILINHQKT